MTRRAKEFSLSQRARDSDFSTNVQERGKFLMEEAHHLNQDIAYRDRRVVRGALIAQLGGNDPFYMAHAAQLLRPYVRRC